MTADTSSGDVRVVTHLRSRRCARAVAFVSLLAAAALLTPVAQALGQQASGPGDLRLYRLGCTSSVAAELRLSRNDFSDTDAYSDEP